MEYRYPHSVSVLNVSLGMVKVNSVRRYNSSYSQLLSFGVFELFSNITHSAPYICLHTVLLI